MKLHELFNLISRIEKSLMNVLFTNKIEKKKVLFQRKYNRKMGVDEIEKYQFSLFTIYALVAMVLILIPFILMVT